MREKEPHRCWIDAHCHLGNEPLKSNYREEIVQAGNHDIEILVSTALNRSEIDWHLATGNPNIRLVAGIHPVYEKINHDDFEYLLDQCWAGKLWGIGEIGLDNREDNDGQQQKILYSQLELARDFDLPVVFHVVHRYNELFRILKNDFPEIRGYLHGFHGSVELVEMFSRFKLGYSLGYKILQKKDSAQTIKRILQHGLLLMETDAPFQKPDNSRNSSSGILCGLRWLIDQICTVSGLKPEKLMEIQWQTFNTIQG